MSSNMGNKNMHEYFKSHPAYDRWRDIGQNIIFYLFKDKIPLEMMKYIEKRFEERVDRDDFDPYFISTQPGIILRKIHYQTKENNWHTQVEWYSWKNRDMLKGKSTIINQCKWELLPLSIFCRRGKDSPISKLLVYDYILTVTKWIAKDVVKARKKISYSAYIQTDLYGNVLKKEYIDGSRNEEFSNKFRFPKQIVSKINRCLSNHFWNDFWRGPPCATWYCTDKGIAYYLDHPQSSKVDRVFPYQDFIKLVDSPIGDEALILLAYTCFSILKPVFSSYPTLQKDAKYVYAKKNIPKQIAINIRSDYGDNAEQLVKVCCGYFQKFTTCKKFDVPVIDGIKVQNSSKKMSRLGVNEFESKVLQPASILWIDRDPNIKLLQSGMILDLCLHPLDEEITNILDNCLSESVVQLLTDVIHNATKRLSANPQECGWMIGEEFLERNDSIRKFRDIKQYSLEAVYKKRLLLLSRYSRRLHLKCETVGEGITTPKLSENRTEIEIDLDENIVRKAAYLSAAFRVFAQVAIPSEDQRWKICNKVEMAIITAFQNQIRGRGSKDIQDVLEDYILQTLKSGGCARIRGENSESEDIQMWYDPKKNVFLVPSKDFFRNLKHNCPALDISKKDILALLIRAQVLCTEQVKNQRRNTYDVVVRRGSHNRMCVVKIKSEALTTKFSNVVHEYLERMRNDKTSYRS